MRAPHSLFLILLIVIGCTTINNEVRLNEEIEALHLKASTSSLDSTYLILSSVKELIGENPQLRDSLKSANNSLLGHYFRQTSKIDSATYYFKAAADAVKDSILNSQEVDYFYFTYDAYKQQQKYGDAIAVADAYKSKLHTEVTPGFEVMLYFMYENVYVAIPDYEKALENNILQEKSYKKTNQIDYIPTILSARARILYYMGDKEKFIALQDSLLQHKENNSADNNLQLYNNYANYSYFEGDFDKAVYYNKQALPYIRTRSDTARIPQGLAVIYANIAEAYVESKQYSNAENYLDSVKLMGIENLSVDTQKNYLNYKLRWAIATNTNAEAVVNDLDALYEFQRKEYEDKFNNELVALTEANEKEKTLQIEKTEAEDKTNRLTATLISAGIGTLALVLGGVFYFRYNKFKLEREHMKTQQRLLRAQMNPHFTFNTLAVIRGMIDENPEGAKNYLVKFSRHLGAIFQNSTFDYILLENELQSLEEYMGLQQMRFSIPFTYQIELNTIEPDLIYVPGMLLQPIVENSLSHGFQGIDYEGAIVIKLKEKGKFLHCTIEDNGQGILKNTDTRDRTSSTQLIARFLEKATNAAFTFTDKRKLNNDDTGVIVSFYIPFKDTLDD